MLSLANKRVVTPARISQQPSKQPSSNQPATNKPPNGSLSHSPSLTPPHPKEENPKGQKKKRRSPKFKPPTPEECIAYAKERGMPASEAEGFHDHYTSNGWKVGGKTIMKDWKASMRNWERNWEKNNPQPAVTKRPKVNVRKFAKWLKGKYPKIYQSLQNGKKPNEFYYDEYISSENMAGS